MLITIIGKRGKGKTTLAKKLIIQNDYDYVFIYDYLGEYYKFSNLDNCYYSNSNFYKIAKACWYKSSKSTKSVLVADEVDLYGNYNDNLEFLYRYGRHRNIDIIAISRRIYDLPIYIRDLTEIFYFFQITEIRGLEYIKQFFSDDIAEKIKVLPSLHYIKLSI